MVEQLFHPSPTLPIVYTTKHTSLYSIAVDILHCRSADRKGGIPGTQRTSVVLNISSDESECSLLLASSV